MDLEQDPARVPGEEWVEAVKKVTSLRPSQADISSAMPEQFAVEAEGPRGEKRIDYIGVPVKNADGTPNKYAKRLIDMHEPAAKAGADLTAKLAAGDYDQKPDTETPRNRESDPSLLPRSAERRGLRPVPRQRGYYFGRPVLDVWGHFNLWLDEHGRLRRLVLHGTQRNMTLEVVPT